MRWTHDERQARPPDSAGDDDHWRYRLYCRDGRRPRLAGATAGLGGYMVAIALKDPVWPFVLILGVEAVAFIAGLAIYGPHGAR
jgi:hypothetical protein